MQDFNIFVKGVDNWTTYAVTNIGFFFNKGVELTIACLF